jgi:esterase/lipase superfamily enzyme
MGNWVTVEALRQIKISGQRLPIDKTGAVILADADIDMDVFKSQMRRFGRPKKPFYVIVSRDDKALQFSSMIAGGQSRLGDDANVQELAALGATVIDLTDLKSNDSFNHDKFAEIVNVAPQLMPVLAKGVSAGPKSKGNLPGSGTLGTIVESSTTLFDAPIRIVSPK